MYKVIDGPGVAQALNRLAREEMKTKLLRDILVDISACRLEGWDYRTYLYELRDLINHILERENYGNHQDGNYEGKQQLAGDSPGAQGRQH